VTDRAGIAYDQPDREWGRLHGGHILGTSVALGGSGGGGGGPAPTVEWLDPAPGSPISRVRDISVRVMDTDLVKLVLTARYPDTATDDVVYRAGQLTPRYRTSQVSEISGGVSFVLRRVGGWLSSPTLQVDAVDATGQIEEVGA
jgi:hypothetical protein